MLDMLDDHELRAIVAGLVRLVELGEFTIDRDMNYNLVFNGRAGTHV